MLRLRRIALIVIIVLLVVFSSVIYYQLFQPPVEPEPSPSPNPFLTQDEVVELARDYAKDYSYYVGDIYVANLTVLDFVVSAEMIMDNGRPLWNVQLPLGERYPGYVTQLSVWVWGDTGELMSIGKG